MFTKTRAFLFATVAAVMLPAVASAATVTIDNSLNANQTFSGVSLITPGGVVEFRFTVLEDLVIQSFSMVATGNNATDDLENIRYGFEQPAMNPFSLIQLDGTAAAALGFLSGGTWLAGSMFSIFFEDGIDDDVGLSLSFRTNVPAIPLPAGIVLLAPLLLAGGMIGLRRRRAGLPAAA
ncbi:MAG: hypothetical protein ACK4TB_05590 [Gemmobacter sp.]